MERSGFDAVKTNMEIGPQNPLTSVLGTRSISLVAPETKRKNGSRETRQMSLKSLLTARKWMCYDVHPPLVKATRQEMRQ